MIHADFIVTGEVQGVFYRSEAKKVATQLNLSGFIRNHDDGSVRGEVEGEESLIDEFLDWCREGSPLAKVEKMEFRKNEELKHFDRFTIRT